MSVRDQRAAAIRRRYRDLADDFSRGLPLLLDDLDDLDAIDQAHAAPAVVVDLDVELTEGQAAELREQVAEAVKPQPAAKPPSAARPATRRRTTR